MCDLDRLSGFLIAAKIAFLLVLVLLGGIIIFSSSFFAAAASIPLMVTLISLGAVATASYVGALVELDRCTAEPCGAILLSMRRDLIALLAIMAVLTIAFIGLALVAAIPALGGAASAGVLAMIVGFTVGVAALAEWSFAGGTQAFNKCRAAAGVTMISEAVVGLAYTNAVVATLVCIGGFARGTFPRTVPRNTPPPPPTTG
jgi:hypothetical protein